MGIQLISVQDSRAYLASYHLIVFGQLELKRSSLWQNTLKLAIQVLLIFPQVILPEPCQTVTDLANV